MSFQCWENGVGAVSQQERGKRGGQGGDFELLQVGWWEPWRAVDRERSGSLREL